ncbi:DUF2293 domain-containing protein [Pseudonocardiaceae bacterium YIM PH 21723]|nr:DUF2293 domain-containing protein [Pseudonocardiaceae bacterium YIM PH 21723]
MKGEAKLEQRVISTAERLLAGRKSVSALEVLTGIGWLSDRDVDAWRLGRAPDLSGALAVGPEKVALALQALQRWAAEQRLEAGEVPHIGASRTREELRVTADDEAERVFRTHWTMPGLSEARRAQVTARQAKVPDLVVVSAVEDWVCAQCGDTGELLFLENDAPHCLDCVDMGHLIFLGAGDATLTRRAKKASGLSAVVMRFNRSRKRYDRLGILLEQGALDQAEESCLADEDLRQRRRVRDGERRAAQDVGFIARFQEEIRRLFPGCPAERAEEIAQHAGTRGSGRVGRSAAGQALDERAVTLAVIASIRHLDTDYDELLMSGVPRQDARDRIAAVIDQVLDRWRDSGRGTPAPTR